MKTKMFEVTCNSCGHTYMVSAPSVINSDLEKDLITKIKDGSFLNRKCKHCGSIITMTYPLIVFDPNQKIQLRYYLACDGNYQYYTDNKQELEMMVKMLDSTIAFDSLYMSIKKIRQKYPSCYYDSEDDKNIYLRQNNQLLVLPK